MKRWTLLGLAAVFVLALVAGLAALAGARAHAQGPWRGGPGMMKRMISAALDEALDQAGVTPEQRTAIYASRDGAFAALDAQRPDPRAHRDQVLALFEADQVDDAQLRALHAQIEQRHQAIRDAVTKAVVEIHDTLTPAQRKIVADYVRTHGPGSMH